MNKGRKETSRGPGGGPTDAGAREVSGRNYHVSAFLKPGPRNLFSRYGRVGICFAACLALLLVVPASRGNLIWATGGDDVYTYSSGGLTHQVHVFETSGTFTVYEDLAQLGNIRYLVLAGGGGGGAAIGGGGGAGGLLTGELTSFGLDTYDVEVGAGGAGATATNARADSGSNSTFHLFEALGGGAGGSFGTDIRVGGDGGSGGGGGWGGDTLGGAGEEGPPRQGYAGGAANELTSGNRRAGGGGGYSSVGGTGTDVPGDGGTGFNAASILGLSGDHWIAGGGGGGAYRLAGGQGLHGGGDGAPTSADPGGDGFSNTGGGGGGGWMQSSTAYTSGGAGGSGLVVISYVIPEPGALLLLAGGGLLLALRRRGIVRG